METGLRRLVRGAAVLLPLALAACQTLVKSPDLCGDGAGDCPKSVCGPRVLHNPTVLSAAGDLDHVEKHLDWHGSVVPKVPDVWGQARLTLYREQFEQEMLKELEQFKETLQGSVARSDQAFALSTTALGLSLGGTVATPAPPQAPLVGVTQSVTTDADGNTTTTTTSANDPAFFFTAPNTAFNPNRFQAFFTARNGEAANLRIGLEPERVLEQKKRYLDLLAQIRRTNEGDDTADSPGYSLQLFRIPVSVLPGKHTDKGHGAEVTMTLTPVLGDDLLPTTFRNLLINDLLNQLGFPLTEVLGDANVTALLNPEFQIFVRVVTQLNDYLSTGNEKSAVALALSIQKNKEVFDAFMKYAKREPEMVTAFAALVSGHTSQPEQMRGLKDQRQVRAALQRNFPTSFNVPSIGFAKGLDNRTAFPTSQLLDVYGSHAVFEVAFGAQKALELSIRRQGYAHLPDVQSHLKEEVGAAYELLRKNPTLLAHYCTPELVQAIRSKQIDGVLKIRQAYRAEVAGLTGFEPLKGELQEPQHLSVTAALGWCLIVDAALLNDRLVRDKREAATARGRIVPGADTWLPYYLPDPPPEARCSFNEYVALRWPIHVFALDPAVQEQNLADRLSTRRELQLALSMAFTSGRINFNQLSRYARRLEAEYETIDLNRTQVGFTHGADTFGWRFYPRFQTPDTPGNLTVIARDLLVGGPNRNQLLRERRLEPGPRECVALVIMPSFVPAVTLNTTANFFGLANPKHKVFDHTQAVKLGRSVQAIKTAGCGLNDANCYRDGDAARLAKRAEQLEARLPLQSVTFSVPTESTLGGFEMFGTSTTDLSPELYGFYGAPGLSSNGTTTLFLVGDHFSPLRTHVIVGNKGLIKVANPASGDAVTTPLAVKKVTLLSRQVMQVEVEAGALPLANGAQATIHVATPYGVSRELLVPIADQKPAPHSPPKGYTLGTDTLTLPYCKKGANAGGPYYLGVEAFPGALKLQLNWGDALGTAPRRVKDVTFSLKYKDCPLSLVVRGPIDEKDGAYTLDSTALQKLLEELLGKLNGFGPFTDESNPLASAIKVEAIKLTPVEGDDKTPLRAVTETAVKGELTFKFSCSVCGDKAVIPGKHPEMPKPNAPKNNDKGGGNPTASPAPATDVPAQLLPALPSIPEPLSPLSPKP